MRSWSAPQTVARHAAEDPAGLAFIDGGTRATWTELAAWIEEAGQGFAGAGVGREAIVALLPGPAMETVAALLGALRIGALVAPLPAGLTRAEQDAAIAMLGPALVSEPAQLAGAARRAGPAVRAGSQRRPAHPNPRPPAGGIGPGVIVLTSGTTGRPKGVILSEAALAASADAWLAVLPASTGWLLAVSLAHVAGLGVLWRAIRDRVPVRAVAAADPAAQLAGLHAHPLLSHVSLVPTQLVRLLDLAPGPPPAFLRAVLLGGGAIPSDLVRRALDRGWPVFPTYGLSEAGSGVTVLQAGEARAVLDSPSAWGAAGRPLPGVTIEIAEPGTDGGGEIVVTTAAGFSGYLGGPPRAPSDPIRTGDLGRLDGDGNLIVLDRRTDRIVRGGENISPAEIEAVLETHPAIAEAAVIGRPDPDWGQVPVAGVVVRDGASQPDDAALAAHVRESLAGYKVPVDFMRLDVLPRTSGGKLLRDAVRRLTDGSKAGELARPGGDRIAWRLAGDGPQPLVLLPGTLSTAAQLDRLAAELAVTGDVMVHALDRRGIGAAHRRGVAPIDVAVHVDDLVAYLDARGIAAAVLVGISFGGVLALETAARLPRRAVAVVAWEPPYGAVSDPPTRAWFEAVAQRTAAAHRSGGAPAAAETFLRAVAGDHAWDSLPARSRAFLAAEGDGAAADSAMAGLDPDGLGRITAPVTILTGDASQPFYGPIADALVARIATARRVVVPGFGHPSPIVEAPRFAALVRSVLAEAGLLRRIEAVSR